MASKLHKAAKLVKVPEGSIPVHGITIVQFIDGDGDPSFLWANHGDPHIDATLGLLAVTEHALVDMIQHPEKYADE